MTFASGLDGSQYAAEASISAPALFQSIRPPIGLLGFVSDNVCKGVLGYLSRKVRFIPRPVSKGAAEAVHRHMLGIPAQHPTQHHLQRHHRERSSGPLAREYELGDSRLGRVS